MHELVLTISEEHIAATFEVFKNNHPNPATVSNEVPEHALKLAMDETFQNLVASERDEFRRPVTPDQPSNMVERVLATSEYASGFRGGTEPAAVTVAWQVVFKALDDATSVTSF